MTHTGARRSTRQAQKRDKNASPKQPSPAKPSKSGTFQPLEPIPESDSDSDDESDWVKMDSDDDDLETVWNDIKKLAWQKAYRDRDDIPAMPEWFASGFAIRDGQLKNPF